MSRSLLFILAVSMLIFVWNSVGFTSETDGEVTQGALQVRQADGTLIECPLKHTDVHAEISGYIARVRVTQTFDNPFPEEIEAVYVFPLPHQAAVDSMTMIVGERRIVGVMYRKMEARQIYQQALEQGKTTALLEQQRPNIFTQQVGNILPGQEIRIELSYVDVLEYDQGIYEFHFPMVVGPRYNATAPFPGVDELIEIRDGLQPKQNAGTPSPGVPHSPSLRERPFPTPQDDSPVTPPEGVNPSYLKPGYRNGHDISLFVALYSGVPIWDLQVPSHEAEVKQDSYRTATARLSPQDSIPNKDFVLRYKVVGARPELAFLCHRQPNQAGYFMLMIQPRLDEEYKTTPPREVVFLVDVSGSMSGAPIAKAKEAMNHFFNLLDSRDTMQVITFASQAERLFEKAVPVTRENVQRGMKFVEDFRAGGGTEMLKGIQMVLNDPLDSERIRIVVMLTDAYIGNEAEIIAEVGRKAGDRIRFWTIGVGTSVNRFLLDGVAAQGGGMAKVLGLQEDPGELVQEVVQRIKRAQLSKIQIDWGGLRVQESYPARIPELWAGRPVILFGRYEGEGKNTIVVRGDMEGQAISYPVEMTFPEQEAQNEVLANIWARQKIEDLMGLLYDQNNPEVVEEITQIALEYNLMSQFTSLVAVDEESAERIRVQARTPRRVDVAVPLPEGVEFEGVFGTQEPDQSVSSGQFRYMQRESAAIHLGYLAASKVTGNIRADSRARTVSAPSSLALGREQISAAGAFRGYHDFMLADEMSDVYFGESFEASAPWKQWSWRLLAAAAKVQADTEALEELRKLWNEKQEPAEMIASVDRLRTLWVLTESSRLLPKEKNLHQFARTALNEYLLQRKAVLQKTQNSPQAGRHHLVVLYEMLAVQNALRLEWLSAVEAGNLLREEQKALGENTTSGSGILGALLVGKPVPGASVKALETQMNEFIPGEDLVFLTALAARRSGNSTWEKFRAEAGGNMSRQPLDGNLVLLVHGLNRQSLPSATIQ